MSLCNIICINLIVFILSADVLKLDLFFICPLLLKKITFVAMWCSNCKLAAWGHNATSFDQFCVRILQTFIERRNIVVMYVSGTAVLISEQVRTWTKTYVFSSLSEIWRTYSIFSTWTGSVPVVKHSLCFSIPIIGRHIPGVYFIYWPKTNLFSL